MHSNIQKPKELDTRPDVSPAADSNDVSAYCGCFNVKKGLLSYVKNANMALLVDAGKDPSWYRDKVAQLLACLTDKDHKHEGCSHHDAGKPPPAAILVTCPFHTEILTGFLTKLMNNAERMIDPELGRVHNNALEVGFAHVWRWCQKRLRMSSVRFRCFAAIGLLHANQTAMFQIRGDGYCAMDEVAKLLGMKVSAKMREYSKKVAQARKHKHDRMNSKIGKFKRSMARRRARLEGSARRQVSALLKKKYDLDFGVSHRSETEKRTLTEGVEVPTTHDDKPTDDGDEDELEPGQVTIAKFKAIMEVPKIMRLLVVLYNEWVKGCEYRNLSFRPHLSKFITALLDLGVHIALWTGSPSTTRQKYLSGLLEPFGLTKDKLVVSWGAWTVCTTSKYYLNKPEKKIVVKPMLLLKQALQDAYDHALLVDNDLEKSLGFSQSYDNKVPVSRPHSKFMNSEEEHYEIKMYDGDKNDNESDPLEGVGARGLFKRIRELQVKYGLLTNKE